MNRRDYAFTPPTAPQAVPLWLVWIRPALRALGLLAFLIVALAFGELP